MRKIYKVVKQNNEPADLTNDILWKNIAEIKINSNSYLWKKNNYCPNVIIKMFHTENSIYLKFKVFEKKITIKHTEFGSEVWKDSCVEFFINPYPKKSEDYFNIEINALGTALIGVGKKRGNGKRYHFKKEEVKDWEIISSVKNLITGEHGKNFWDLYIKIPKSFFKNRYNEYLNIKNCIANFYKCGDETEFVHYGAWNKIESPVPNFHLPEYFGELQFLEN